MINSDSFQPHKIPIRLVKFQVILRQVTRWNLARSISRTEFIWFRRLVQQAKDKSSANSFILFVSRKNDDSFVIKEGYELCFEFLCVELYISVD